MISLIQEKRGSNLADFNTGVTSPTAGPSSIPTASSNPASSNTISILSGALGGLGSAISTAIQNDAAQKAKNAKNKALESVQQGILRIADAQDQGVLTQDQARSRARLLQSQALANDPSLREDINKVFDSTLGSTGLAASIRTGTQSEQDNHALEMKAIQDAQDHGYSLPWMTDEQKQQGVINYQKVQQAQIRLKAATDDIAFKQSQVNLTNARLTTVKSQLQITGEQLSNAGKSTSNQIGRINLANAQHEQEVIAGSQAMFDATSNDFEMKARHIASQVDSGQLDRDAGRLAIQEINRRQHLAIDPAVAAGGAAGRVAGTLGGLLDKRAELWTNYVSGSIKQDQLKTDLNTQDLTEQQIVLQSDPTFKKHLAVQHLVGVALPELSAALFKDTISHIVANSPTDSDGNPKANPTEAPANILGTGGMDPQAASQYLDMTKTALRKVNAGNGTPEDQADIDTHVRNIVGGVGTFGSTAKNPTKLDTVVSFMAGPEFGAYSAKHPAIYTGQEAAEAREVLGRFYNSKVIPLIQDEFTTNNVTVGQKPGTSTLGAGKGLLEPDVRSTSGTISVSYDKNQVRFTPNDNFKNNDAVVKKAAELNNNVGPVINKIVKMQAHMDGSLDYNQYFTEVIDSILPPQSMVQNVEPVRGQQ